MHGQQNIKICKYSVTLKLYTLENGLFQACNCKYTA